MSNNELRMVMVFDRRPAAMLRDRLPNATAIQLLKYFCIWTTRHEINIVDKMATIFFCGMGKCIYSSHGIWSLKRMRRVVPSYIYKHAIVSYDLDHHVTECITFASRYTCGVRRINSHHI